MSKLCIARDIPRGSRVEEEGFITPVNVNMVATKNKSQGDKADVDEEIVEGEDDEETIVKKFSNAYEKIVQGSGSSRKKKKKRNGRKKKGMKKRPRVVIHLHHNVNISMEY
ncbi:hypothetical protein LIER_36000 [Lithospermum erythrorhizon]|uniref:Uncharacterized protein n=1 Tax=Lithospermum erythrorhizon TaxID=34254 RepID=A0AAV3P217_LITER